MKLETENTVSRPPGAQRPENRPAPRHAGLLRRRLPRSGQLLQRDEGQRGMGRRAPRPPTDGQPPTNRRCGSLASVMVLPLPLPLLPVANVAVANWEWGPKTGNTPRPVYRQHFKNREICDDHSLQTVVIAKPTTVSNRFLALLYQPQSLQKLPPHFAKCGGNQKNDSLPYFLLLHLNAHEELFRRQVLRCRLAIHLAAFGLAECDIDIPFLEFALIQRSSTFNAKHLGKIRRRRAIGGGKTGF